MKKLREKMRNIGKYSLTIFLCALALFAAFPVHAEESVSSATGGGGVANLKVGDKIAVLQSGGNYGETSGGGNAISGRIAAWSLKYSGGIMRAFCISHGVRGTVGTTYKLAGTYTANPRINKAVSYYLSGTVVYGANATINSQLKYIIAQAGLWSALGTGTLVGNIKTALLNNKNVQEIITKTNPGKGPTGLTNEAERVATALAKVYEGYSGAVTLYRWVPACGTGQEYVTYVANGDTYTGEGLVNCPIARNCNTVANDESGNRIYYDNNGNKLNGGYDEWLKVCDDEPEQEDPCVEQRKSFITGDTECYESVYTDTQVWECIFPDGRKQSKQTSESKKYFRDSSFIEGYKKLHPDFGQQSGAGLSSITVDNIESFCSYYCREDATTQFSVSTENVYNAGRYYTIGDSAVSANSMFAYVAGARTCKSYSYDTNKNGISYDTFVTQLKNAVKNVYSVFKTYQNDLAILTSYKEATKTENQNCNLSDDKYVYYRDATLIPGKPGGVSCPSDHPFQATDQWGTLGCCATPTFDWNTCYNAADYTSAATSDTYECSPGDESAVEGGKHICKHQTHKEPGDADEVVVSNIPTKYYTYYTATYSGTSLQPTINEYSGNGKFNKTCLSKSEYDSWNGKTVSFNPVLTAQTNLKRIMHSINACDVANTLYVLDPTVTYKYSEQAFNYGCNQGDIPLKVTSINYSTVESDDAAIEAQKNMIAEVNSTTAGVTFGYIDVCSEELNGKCTSESFTLSHISSNESAITTYSGQRVLSYGMDDTAADFTSKANGSVGGLSSSEKSKNLYSDFPAGALPLSFNLESGAYNMPLFEFSNFGNMYDSTAHFDFMIENGDTSRGADTKNQFLYVCALYIENDILEDCGSYCGGDISCIRSNCPTRQNNVTEISKYCEPTGNGLVVIYRTIQLEEDAYIRDVTGTSGTIRKGDDYHTTFPSYNGNGREPGYNWTPYHYNDKLLIDKAHGCNNSAGGSCSASKVIDPVTEYVNNNRDVKGYEVYNKKPLYTFVLTPVVVKKIRAYNSTSDGPNYKGAGYDDWSRSMECYSSDISGRNCLSSFIHDFANKNGFLFTSQSACHHLTPSNVNSNFDECRYN